MKVWVNWRTSEILSAKEYILQIRSGGVLAGSWQPYDLTNDSDEMRRRIIDEMHQAGRVDRHDYVSALELVQSAAMQVVNDLYRSMGSENSAPIRAESLAILERAANAVPYWGDEDIVPESSLRS